MVYIYTLHPTNAFADTRTVIMFPNLSAIGLRPNNFVINKTDFIGLSPYGIEDNDTIIINVALARQSANSDAANSIKQQSRLYDSFSHQQDISKYR